MKIVGIIFFIVLLAIGLSFTVLNADTVQLNYYFGSSQLPLAAALVFASVVGVLLGLLGGLGAVIRLKREIIKLKKSVKSAEKELTQLRALPIKDSH